MMISDAIKVYELLREPLGNAYARDLVASHYSLGSISYVKEGDEMVAAAFSWHIADPYDVEVNGGYPGEDVNGKYLYFPMIFVREENRATSLSHSIVRNLLFQAFSRSPKASRAAFHRQNGRGEKLKIVRFDRDGTS